MSKIVPSELIESRIFLFRGQKVMLGRDLAELYEVSTKALNQAVKRNIERFPEDFMFRLAPDETKELVTNCDRFASLKHSTAAPHAFTEQGVAMLSSVLKSRRAIEVNIAIMRAFVKLRKMLASNEELKRRLAAMERKYDGQFKVVFDAIKQLMTDDVKPKRKIGFLASAEDNVKKKRK